MPTKDQILKWKPGEVLPSVTQIPEGLIRIDTSENSYMFPASLLSKKGDTKVLKKTPMTYAAGVNSYDGSLFYWGELPGVTAGCQLEVTNPEDVNYWFWVDKENANIEIIPPGGLESIVNGPQRATAGKEVFICCKQGDIWNTFVYDADRFVFTLGAPGGTPLTLTALTLGSRTGLNEAPLPSYVAVGGGSPWEHFGLSPNYLASANPGFITWQLKTGKVSALSFRRENLSTHYAGSSGAYSNNHAMAFNYSDGKMWVIPETGTAIQIPSANWTNNMWAVIAKEAKQGGGWTLKLYLATDPALKSTWGSALYEFTEINFDMYIQGHCVNDGDTITTPKSYGLS